MSQKILEEEHRGLSGILFSTLNNLIIFSIISIIIYLIMRHLNIVYSFLFSTNFTYLVLFLEAALVTMNYASKIDTHAELPDITIPDAPENNLLKVIFVPIILLIQFVIAPIWSIIAYFGGFVLTAVKLLVMVLSLGIAVLMVYLLGVDMSFYTFTTIGVILTLIYLHTEDFGVKYLVNLSVSSLVLVTVFFIM